MKGQKSTETYRKFKWDDQKRQAAQLLAEDELTCEEIAAKIGCVAKTLYNWRQHPEFAVRVREIVEEFGGALQRIAIAKRGRRVRNLNDRLERMHQVIRDRAADPGVQDIPGGNTGLMVRTIKVVGSGPAAERVEEYEVDTGLLKELREHEKQAAIELGQWTEKREHSIAEIDDAIRAELGRVASLGQAGPAGATSADPDPGRQGQVAGPNGPDAAPTLP